MPTYEIDLPGHLEAEIDRMVDQGEFLTREEAFEELLTAGVSAYNVDTDDDEEMGIGDEMTNPGDVPPGEDEFGI